MILTAEYLTPLRQATTPQGIVIITEIFCAQAPVDMKTLTTPSKLHPAVPHDRAENLTNSEHASEILGQFD